MKTLLAVLSALLLAFIGYFAYRLDQWVGIVAFTYPYLFFCTVVGLLYWGAWFPCLKKRAFVIGLAAFSILSINFLLPAPSERILRTVMMRLPPGTSSDTIEEIVEEAYDGSGYVFPQIIRGNTSVRVSLLSQRSGNCTALIINTKDGVVVSSAYSQD